jgi:YVTN family beta-propeller protein
MRKLPLALIATAALALAAGYANRLQMGKQPDGTFIVATAQRIDPGTVAFNGRPMDIALHPKGEVLAVVKQDAVLAIKDGVVVPDSITKLAAGCSFHGCAWSPDGGRFFVSLSKGQVQWFNYSDSKFAPGGTISLAREGVKTNPVPGGMAITQDGSRLYVACANFGAVAEVDLTSNQKTRELKVENIPFDVKLSADEKTLIVSNWAGREAREKEETAESGPVGIFVEKRGMAASGTVSLVNLESGEQKDVAVGLHPSGIAVDGNHIYVANAASDSISEIDLAAARVTRTIPIRWEKRDLFGSMPNGLAVRGDKLYACNGGDNALCEINLRAGRIGGFRPAGFFPTGVVLSTDGRQAFVVNTKGNGSVRNTLAGKPGNAHDFQGTVSLIDLTADIAPATEHVIANNGWRTAKETLNPQLAVYKGAIKHVLYIIKENRTYDQVFGDMPEGNGDPKICTLGEMVTPNHHSIAKEFTLFDNAYVSGTNSAEGHQWALEGLANDYIERFYAGYSRSYPYDGGDAMAYSSGGFIWDAAKKKGKSIRIYGEFCQEQRVKFTPKPGGWLDAWEDRESGANKFKVEAGTSVASIRKDIHPSVICWPLTMSDQWRADQFIAEYTQFSSADKVPNLMILTLPSDHTQGTSPGFPKPRSMVADNDLALGRVIEAVSKSPQWKDTCIFVMEDDAQGGPDHVDGHRTVCLVASPYTRRGITDSTLYTQISIVRSIELMLGLDPMTKFDTVAIPFTACFTDTPDTRPYAAVPNQVKLGDMNPPLKALRGEPLYWAKKSLSLDWSGVDTADWNTLNQILKFSLQ